MTGQGLKMQQFNEEKDKNDFFDTELWKATSSNNKVFFGLDIKSVISTFK